MNRNRTRKLSKERRRFSFRVSDDQTLFLEKYHTQEAERTGRPDATAPLGEILDEILEQYPPFQEFQKKLEGER